jgi:hypothetical protein
MLTVVTSLSAAQVVKMHDVTQHARNSRCQCIRLPLLRIGIAFLAQQAQPPTQFRNVPFVDCTSGCNQAYLVSKAFSQQSDLQTADHRT